MTIRNYERRREENPERCMDGRYREKRAPKAPARPPPKPQTLGEPWVGRGGEQAVFSFLYFLKIKISKIYVRFEIFQKYTPVTLP